MSYKCKCLNCAYLLLTNAKHSGHCRLKQDELYKSEQKKGNDYWWDSDKVRVKYSAICKKYKFYNDHRESIVNIKCKQIFQTFETVDELISFIKDSVNKYHRDLNLHIKFQNVPLKKWKHNHEAE